MSIYDLIKNDHRTVEQLFSKLGSTKDTDKRFELFEELRENLLAHTKAEERVLYARLASSLPDKIAQSRDEHASVELLLVQLADLDPDDDEFPALVQQLRESVEHHVNEEEKTLLPKAQQILGPDDDNTLADRMLQEERRLMDADERGELEGERPESRP